MTDSKPMQRFKKIKLTQGKYARLWAHGKYIHVGTFKTKLAAHRAYIKKAKELHGEFVRWK